MTDALKSSKKINPALTGLASFGTSAIMSSLGQGLSKGFKSFFGKGGFKGVGEQMASLPKMPKSEMAVGKDFLKKLSPESIADLAPADATEIISQYQKTYMPETTKGLGKFGPKTKLSIEDLTKKREERKKADSFRDEKIKLDKGNHAIENELLKSITTSRFCVIDAAFAIAVTDVIVLSHFEPPIEPLASIEIQSNASE